MRPLASLAPRPASGAAALPPSPSSAAGTTAFGRRPLSGAGGAGVGAAAASSSLPAAGLPSTTSAALPPSPAFGLGSLSRAGSAGLGVGRAASAGVGVRTPGAHALGNDPSAGAAAATSSAAIGAGARGGLGLIAPSPMRSAASAAPLSAASGGGFGTAGAATTGAAGTPVGASTSNLLRSLRPGSAGAAAAAASLTGAVEALGLGGATPLVSAPGLRPGSGLTPSRATFGAPTPMTGGYLGGQQQQHLRLGGASAAFSPGAAGAAGSAAAPAFSCTVLSSTARTSSRPLALHFGSGCTQGFRPTMEDEHLNLIGAHSVDGNPISIFAILDGHCGRRVAELGVQMLPEALFTHPAVGQNNALALVESVMQVDKQVFAAIRNQDGGATFICALVHKRMLFVANLGDARAVLCDSGAAVPMSVDHKPTDAAEQARIVRCGGFVHFGRVSGCLAVSRALGDFEFKCGGGRFVQKEFQVSNVPDIRQINLTDGSRFLVIACDGLWDVMSSDEAVAWVTDFLGKNDAALNRNPGDVLNRAAKAMADAAVAKGSTDNVSVTIVLFHTPGSTAATAAPAASPATPTGASTATQAVA
jgi:protein phosphatase